MPAASNARLKATRWPSLSVSTSTPSQSKIRAFIARARAGLSRDLGQHFTAAIRAAELRDLFFEELLQRVELRPEHAQRLVVRGLGLVIVDEAVDEHVLQ